MRVASKLLSERSRTPGLNHTIGSRLRSGSESGQSLVEFAVCLPVLVLLMAYAIDFAYFFIAAANITSAARNGAQYSVMGYQGPAQSSLAPAGPVSTTTSVASLAMADMVSLLNSSTTTTVRVCSKALGMSGNIPNCSSYGPTATAPTPAADPEAPTFVLQRVDVTYTVQPPVPLSIFGTSLLPNLQFHRQVSMRAMD
jgi:Flp pilus assembly protein TadG